MDENKLKELKKTENEAERIPDFLLKKGKSEKSRKKIDKITIGELRKLASGGTQEKQAVLNWVQKNL